MPIEGPWEGAPNILTNAGKLVTSWPNCKRNGQCIFCGNSFTNIG